MDKNSTDRLAMAMGAAQFGVLVAGGLLGGLWIDKKFGTTPLWGLLGLVAGFAAGLRIAIRLVRGGKSE